jgi:hypothetical protein
MKELLSSATTGLLVPEGHCDPYQAMGRFFGSESTRVQWTSGIDGAGKWFPFISLGLQQWPRAGSTI